MAKLRCCSCEGKRGVKLVCHGCGLDYCVTCDKAISRVAIDILVKHALSGQKHLMANKLLTSGCPDCVLPDE